MKVIVLQPSVPSYRAGFFERVGARLGPSLLVYASVEDLGVLTAARPPAAWERPLGPMRRLPAGFSWQPGALSIPFSHDDVLVVSGNPRCLSNVLLLAMARLKGVRTIWWGQYWSSTSRAWRAGIRMILMRLASGVLLYTDVEVTEHRTANAGDRRPISALNNGIDTDRIVSVRRPYSPKRQRDLLFIGRLTPKADLATLLEALSLPVCADMTLDVIGEGEHAARLKRLCSELGISGRVTWHGGTIDERRIAAVANACKVFAYPGGVGLSLIHGMAYGLPAVVHDDRWKHMPEIAALRPGESGVTFRRGDARSLADAAAGLLVDEARLEAMSRAAIATTTESFNAADMAERFCAAVGRLGDSRTIEP